MRGILTIFVNIIETKKKHSLFITAYVAYDALFVNIVFGAIALLPKLPQFHRVRLFGINA